jgi:hypothetical protein
MKTYKIVRNFFEGRSKTIKRGLTLEEVREHCKNPETSSRTCSEATAKRLGLVGCVWFDGYEEE